MIDWSSFFLGILATYIVSGLGLLYFVKKAPVFEEKPAPKSVQPTYTRFDKNSGRASMGWGEGDYY